MEKRDITKGFPGEPHPKTGYCADTKTFHSLRPAVPLPPRTTHLSAAAYAFLLQSNSPWTDASAAFIDSTTGRHVSYSQFRHYVKALAFYLRTVVGLSKNDVAFVISPNSTLVPILYFSMLSLGVVICPANPLSTRSEISRQVVLSKPVVAFVTSATKAKVAGLRIRTIVIDSDEFESMMTRRITGSGSEPISAVEVNQDDVAAILFSSGTTGNVKAAMLTHRNFIAIISSFYHQRQERTFPAVVLCMPPYFHVFGFSYSLKSVALKEAVVEMERYELERMLKSVEDYKVTHLAVVTPIVVAMLKNDATDNFDLGSLEAVGCGAAPLGKDVSDAFVKKFHGVTLYQGYGMTETAGGIFRTASPEESLRRGSVGKLQANCEAMIVDPERGTRLPPGRQGELWVRGPMVMKGYVDDPKANYETLVMDGWLRTGDVCYIDDEGFLFVVDRMKELIKYKGYQVPPAELEQLLHSHPDIVDAAVIPSRYPEEIPGFPPCKEVEICIDLMPGIKCRSLYVKWQIFDPEILITEFHSYPDEDAGQVPLAFVVRRPQSSLDEGQVMKFIAEQVAPYKKVRHVVFTGSIPKSTSGKILRRELKKISLPHSKL